MTTRLLLSFFLLAGLIGMAGPETAQAQNTPPVAVNDAASGFVLELISIDVLDNDSDADPGDTLTITRLPTRPAKGDAAIVGTPPMQQVLYRSNPNVSGTDAFTYEISDGQATATATVTITLMTNAAPVAVDDEADLFSHEIVEVDVLDNDTDADGDSLHIAALPELPLHGTATIVLDSLGQRVRYDPVDTFGGRDSLSYTVADDFGATDTARVFFDVTVNQPPVANDDSLAILLNAIVEVAVLDNDTDPEGDSLFVLSISAPPANGTAQRVAGTNRIRYTPDTGFLGNDQFEYTISDGLSRNGSQIADRATVFISVLPPNGSFEALLSGANVIPAAQSRASGLILATLVDNELAFNGTFSRLESPLEESLGAILGFGLAGQNGNLARTLTVTTSPDRLSGTLVREDNTFMLTNAELAALFARGLYVNVLTDALPNGEIRGQLLPADPTGLFRAVFSGRAEAPPNRSGAVGNAAAELYGNSLIVTGAFSGLASALGPAKQGGAAIHQGDLGGVGAERYALTTTLAADGRSGAFERNANQFLLSPDEVSLLENGLLYINIPTVDLPNGEIRGQLLPVTTRVFEATLAGLHEVPSVDSPGDGGLLATLDGATLKLTGRFSGLASDVDLSVRNGAHIHVGAPDATGGIAHDLFPFLQSNRRSGSFLGGNNQVQLSVDELQALFDGQLYANVHTLDQPAGEIRGQLLVSGNVAPVQTTTSTPPDGAVFDLSISPNTIFPARWFSSLDANGNAIYYQWQLALDPDFTDLLFASDLTASTETETIYDVIVKALSARGISISDNVRAYHRVVSTDGSLEAAGPAAEMILGDGTVTDVEDAGAVPERFAVRGNYPNPFNPATTVHVDLPQAAQVHVEVFDLLGRRVQATPAQALPAGARRAVVVDASALAAGVYLYRVVARTAAETLVGTGRMTLVK